MSGFRLENIGGSVEFGVLRLPDRKNPALYLARGAMNEVLAYFRSEEDARRFEKALNFAVKILERAQKKR